MVYILLADGFEEVETITPIDILRRGGAEVKIISIKDDTVTGAHGITIKSDSTLSTLEVEDFDALILPGGPGHELLDISNETHALINMAITNNKYIAAICAAPSILGKKMILNNKNATCFPGYEKHLYGANIQPDKVVVDGKIITAKGAGAAAEFGFEILSALKGRELADTIKELMQY